MHKSMSKIPKHKAMKA